MNEDLQMRDNPFNIFETSLNYSFGYKETSGKEKNNCHKVKKKKVTKPNFSIKPKNRFQMFALQNTIHDKRKEFVNKTANITTSNIQHYLNINKSKCSDAQNTNLSYLEDLKENKKLLENHTQKKNYYKILRLNILKANNINNIFINYKDCQTLSNLRDLSRSRSKENIKITNKEICNNNNDKSKSNNLKLKKCFFDNDNLKHNLTTVPLNNKKSILNNIKINLLKEKMNKLAKFKVNKNVLNFKNKFHKNAICPSEEKLRTTTVESEISPFIKNVGTEADISFNESYKKLKEALKKKNNVYQTINKHNKLTYFTPSDSISKSPDKSKKSN